MRIHGTDIDEPAAGAPLHSRQRRLHCSDYPRIVNHLMGLFSHTRISDSGIHCAAVAPSIPSTPIANPAHSTPIAGTTNTNTISEQHEQRHPIILHLLIRHFYRTCISRIGLVDQV
ncbi:unnamed protein product [Dibothriocephalus latus]|uniref:Uncharacterized protein n=1 Tax=Dibothriocephalus latus TaxID=60516 RepID=A0A3P6TVN1_DIBLA|nr:unnamed protein product [Dibothriocephalus latus]